MSGRILKHDPDEVMAHAIDGASVDEAQSKGGSLR